MKKIFNSIYYRLFPYYKRWYIKRFISKRGSKYIKQQTSPIDREIIVSFTSIPSRLEYLPLMTRSIFDQTIKPDRFILYIYRGEFAHIDIKSVLREQIERGLEIRYVDENLKSHKKYFYAKQEFSEACIILVDDDIIYKPNLIELLVKSYRKHPHSISANRIHRIKLEKQLPKTYTSWDYEYMFGIRPSHRIFFTAGGGTLLPPILNTPLLFDKEQIRELSFSADDVWLNLIALKEGIRVVKARIGKGTPLEIDNNPVETLAYENVTNGNNNDISIHKMMDYFGIKYEKE